MERTTGPNSSFILGVDIGSAAISAVEVSLAGDVLRTYYTFHNGDIFNTLSSLLANLEFPLIQGIACTSVTPDLINRARRYDSRIACIAAAKHNHARVGSLLTVGAEKFSLITFDLEGNYRNLRTNTSCAAGTGSFLEEQAEKLEVPIALIKIEPFLLT